MKKSLSPFTSPEHSALLKGIRRGIEKESLRVTPEGQLANTSHPTALGSTLTNPFITTDYSEALLEFITPPLDSASAVLQTLDNIHRFTYRHIDDQLLWVNSMPCVLGRDADIPVARYGSSNIGKMKTLYREGLGHRYGRLMQTIAGIHYNWSLPDECWVLLQQHAQDTRPLKDFKTERYFALIRNFKRHFWLLLYLFGAAPAVCRSFVAGRAHGLVPFGRDDHSLHMPYSTSLRMGDLGYQSDAQASLIVCYNDLRSYINNLRGALTKPYPAYEQIGLRDRAGNYLQLSTNLLQIENEFYSAIRPKRTTQGNETPLKALWERGVEYVEVRCIDLNPLLPVGIDAAQIHFLDSFLLHCLLSDSPPATAQEYRNILENQRRVVYRGRDPALTLIDGKDDVSLRAWATKLLSEVGPVAALLDTAHGGNAYGTAVDSAGQRVTNPELIPAARILAQMAESGSTYFQTALGHARQHREYFLDTPLDPAIAEEYAALAAESLAEQRAMEAADTLSFDQFLANYYAQYDFDMT